MNRILIFVFLALSVMPASAANVGISISVGEPGYYGRLDIGDYPRPRLIYTEPIIVRHRVLVGPPIYLRVPPHHRRHWDRYCDEYRACSRRVYFVDNGWYEHTYVPAYRHKHHKDRHDKKPRRHRPRLTVPPFFI